jgi:hypothetical protein
MQAVTTIGLDIAKSVFQIHGVDAAGNVIVRRQIKRGKADMASGRRDAAHPGEPAIGDVRAAPGRSLAFP